MGTKKSWKYYLSGRKSQQRNLKKHILIVCEGTKTEPNYFKSFRLPTARVVVNGTGKDTIEVVNKAIIEKKKAIKNRDEFDSIWCVFDRDSFPEIDFNKARKLAKENGIKVAYSNEAFEIWYLLHFSYFVTSMSRKSYEKKLSSLLKKPYKKNSTTIYQELYSRQKIAIANAKKLIKEYPHPDPAKNNPSTTVFELVIELNKNL